MSPTIVLITGANRGIGKGLLGLYLERPNHIVIAANRNPEHPTSKALSLLPKAEDTKLVILKLDILSPMDPAAAVQELAGQGIDRVDVLIANAGIALKWPKLSELRAPEDVQPHVDTNVYGFVRLYQAFLSMLKKAGDPKWVTIGSSAGFLTVNYNKFPNAAYGPTKLVQHFYTRAMAHEEPQLTAFPIDPGWVQTEMGDRGAHAFGIEKAAITVEESVKGMIEVIDASTRETHSGKLWVHDGHQEPW